MSWHYQLMRHTEPDGEVWYGVHKNYYRSGSCTVEPVNIKSEDKEDIKWMLEAMLMDIEKHGVKTMSGEDLTPADAAVLAYLRGQVDRLQDERWRAGARPSIANELKIAMRDLREFTSAKRQQGFNI